MAQTLTISQLFTPATNSQWFNTFLSNSQSVQLQTTSWQSGGMAVTILQIMSYMFAQEDAAISVMAQAGFLDFAASGTVTYVAANGVTVTQPVTPDPSIPLQNPNGTPGWLDVLGTSVYNVTRNGSTQAPGNLYLVNTGANTYSYTTPGSYHVANLTTKSTYSNVGSLSIVPSSLAGVSITNATPASPIVITTSIAHGLATNAYVYIAGVLGLVGANGWFQIVSTGTTTFQLVGSSGTGVYSSGGLVYIPQVAAFQADLAGPNGTSGVGQITQPVTSNSGVVVNNFGAFVGTPFESNTNYAARCRAKLAALSPSGPGDAYRYFATTANTILAAQTPPVALSAPITQAIVSQSLATGITTTYVANVTGAVSGCVQLPVTGATNASPIVISTSSAHGLSTGQYAKISGVQGNTAANNTPTNATWTITYVDATHFSLNNSTGNATYVGGGYIEGGDLGLVDSVIQANVVPDATTAIVASAANWNVAIIATVQVAAAYANTYAANVQVALATYFATIPIGGGTVGVIEYNNVIGVLYAAGIVSASSPQVVAITTLTLNGTSGNISFPTPYSIAQLSPTPIITVVSV